MTVVVALSAFLGIMFLSRESSLSAHRTPGHREPFGFSILIAASSNLTSSKKVSNCSCFFGEFGKVFFLEARLHSAARHVQVRVVVFHIANKS